MAAQPFFVAALLYHCVMMRRAGAIEARVKDLVVMMMSTNTVTACNRFYKRPHPGRKHLVKYPRKLDPRPPNEQEWSPGARLAKAKLVVLH
jgi:hypothetical protein